MLGNVMEVDNPTRIILHIASGPMLIMEDWGSDFTCYEIANSFCISSKVRPLVSGYTNKTTKNCKTIMAEKKTNG